MIHFQYQVNPGPEWTTYISAPDYILNIGTHTYTQDRSMGIEIDISRPEYNDPVVPNGETWHRACAWAWFDAYWAYGNGQCTVPVKLIK